MRQIFVIAGGLSDWQSRLAAPQKHWKRGYSAFELAVSWELAAQTQHGIPACVKNALDQHADLRDATLLIAIPEHQVALPGTGKASCTDLWALLDTPVGQVSMAVEAKVNESFGDTCDTWLKAGKSSNSPQNRQNRLDALCQILGLSTAVVGNLRYQLLHRTASAILEAHRFRATQAILLVQSFSSQTATFQDFELFGLAMGASVQRNALTLARPVNELPLWLGWVDCLVATDIEVAQAPTGQSHGRLAGAHEAESEARPAR